ncbi:MAG: Npun_F0813 family protein [Pseudanabaenaceae cyanobacterium]
MFVLKRQDVEIVNVQNPLNRDQQLPILRYQGQAFRLLDVFGDNREEAMALWRDLTDNKGKACVLLEEPHRYSVWGRVKLENWQVGTAPTQTGDRLRVQGCLLFLQTVAQEVEDFFGARQSNAFRQELLGIFQRGRFPQGESAEALTAVLTQDPLDSMQLPAWDDGKLQFLLGELHRVGMSYFGNTSFVETALDVLEELRGDKGRFLEWLRSTPKGKLWLQS